MPVNASATSKRSLFSIATLSSSSSSLINSYLRVSETYELLVRLGFSFNLKPRLTGFSLTWHFHSLIALLIQPDRIESSLLTKLPVTVFNLASRNSAISELDICVGTLLTKANLQILLIK